MLREQLDNLTRALQIYLQYILPKEPRELEPIGQIAEIAPKYIISFNYTDTYKVYGIEKESVLHIHGSLEDNNMVLGFQDDNPDDLDFVYFKKYFQRIQKLTGYIEQEKMYENRMGVISCPIIHFYGHSMDKTDGEIIKKLKSMANKFVIYKYNQDDYEQKVVNLIEVFGKEEATKLIQERFIEFVPCE
ncbi:MAG: hypothetical protein E7299_05380 [Lachnospiraceae bacterium]|nr:hypothetical protein [Lachnospiraceae bacterium]